MNKFLSLLCPTLLSGCLIIGAIGNERPLSPTGTEKRGAKESARAKKAMAIPTEYLRFAGVRDTVYVLGDSYIEISLREQKARHFFRQGGVKEYKISSGNPYIREGMATPTGLFSVQTKNPLGISKQFKDAKLHYWVGFNGNIGFHGLDGRGYYWNLGLRPSSHGCVRIGREDGEKLFKDAKKGTPVLVYKDEPARVLAFADERDFTQHRDILLEKKNPAQIRLLRRRLSSLYEGRYYFSNYQKVFMDGKTPLWTDGKLEVGETDLIPPTQERPIFFTGSRVSERRDRFDKIFAFVEPAPDSSLSRAQ